MARLSASFLSRDGLDERLNAGSTQWLRGSEGSLESISTNPPPSIYKLFYSFRLTVTTWLTNELPGWKSF